MLILTPMISNISDSSLSRLSFSTPIIALVIIYGMKDIHFAIFLLLRPIQIQDDTPRGIMVIMVPFITLLPCPYDGCQVWTANFRSQASRLLKTNSGTKFVPLWHEPSVTLFNQQVSINVGCIWATKTQTIIFNIRITNFHHTKVGHLIIVAAIVSSLDSHHLRLNRCSEPVLTGNRLNSNIIRRGVHTKFRNVGTSADVHKITVLTGIHFLSSNSTKPRVSSLSRYSSTSKEIHNL